MISVDHIQGRKEKSGARRELLAPSSELVEKNGDDVIFWDGNNYRRYSLVELKELMAELEKD